MSVSVSTLPRRTPAALRRFVTAQTVGAQRHPDTVEPATPSDRDYWRYLVRRVPLEGLCAKYQTYDASGAENDWNINIVPDEQYAWMLDHGILHALSDFSGAPETIDLSEIKRFDGREAIECELTPDDDLYDTFVSWGLPISAGSWWPEGSENEGLGPTGSPVGVYGVYCGDYGHGGRPEVHPFDAYWRRFSSPAAPTALWDLGVFQDDSNRFNSDWSRPPVDMELRLPFALDFPVGVRRARRLTARFELQRSPTCSVVAKNTQVGAGQSSIVETYVGGGPLLFRSSLEITVADETGAPGRPFRLSLAGVHYTSTGVFPGFGAAWLSGYVVLRVAVGQDGFAFWRLTGPNSRTASTAADDGPVITDHLAGADDLVARRRRGGGDGGGGGDAEPARVHVAEVRPRVGDGATGDLAAEVLVEEVRPAGPPVRTTLTVRPRRQPVLRLADRSTVRLESFDLVARATPVARSAAAPAQVEADVTAEIARLAVPPGQRLRRSLTAVPAVVELDDAVAFEVGTRYAPYRDGGVQGEERSALSQALSAAVTAPVRVDGSVVVRSLDGTERTVVVDQDTGRRLDVTGLDTPVSLRLQARCTDAYDLTSEVRAAAHNYRLVQPAGWLEAAAGVRLADVQARRDALVPEATRDPQPELVRGLGLLRCLAAVLDDLSVAGAASPRRVAGALGLAVRVDELLGEAGVTTTRRRARPRWRAGGPGRSGRSTSAADRPRGTPPR